MERKKQNTQSKVPINKRSKNRARKRQKTKRNEPRTARGGENGLIIVETNFDKGSTIHDATANEKASTLHRAKVITCQANEVISTLTRMIRNVSKNLGSIESSLKAREALKELDRLIHKAERMAKETAKLERDYACTSLAERENVEDELTAKLEHTENEMEGLLNTVNLLEVMENSEAK